MLCELQAEGGSRLALPESHTPQPLVGYSTAPLPRETSVAPCTVATLALPPPTVNLRRRGLPSCLPPSLVPFCHTEGQEASKSIPRPSFSCLCVFPGPGLQAHPQPSPLSLWVPPTPPYLSWAIGLSRPALHRQTDTVAYGSGGLALLGPLPWPQDRQHLGPWVLNALSPSPSVGALQPPCPFTVPVSPPALCGGTHGLLVRGGAFLI